MDFVKACRLRAGLMNHFQRPNTKAARNNAIDNLARVARAHGVGLDDCESKITHTSARVPVSSRAILRASLTADSLSGGSDPTKSVNADFGRLTSSSQWIALSCFNPSSIPTDTCVERP